MGKLESITTLAGIAVGGLVFLKVYPLIEGFLKGGSGLGGLAGGGGTGLADFADSLIPRFGEQPLRTFEPVPEVRPILSEATEVVPGISFPVSPQRLEYQENIGVPILTSEVYEETKRAWEIQQQPPPQTTVQSLPGLDYLLRTASLPGGVLAPQAAQPSGEYWVNPITGANIGTYIAGQTPPAVLRLREQDIFPAIRGF